MSASLVFLVPGCFGFTSVGAGYTPQAFEAPWGAVAAAVAREG